MKIINLTPHDVVVVTPRGDKLVFPKSESPARVGQITTKIGEISEIPLFSLRNQEVDGLPEEEVGTRLIVSRIIANECPNRHDLLVPHGTYRDEKSGAILGCTGFAI